MEIRRLQGGGEHEMQRPRQHLGVGPAVSSVWGEMDSEEEVRKALKD
jgi:hypothetical protein